MKLPILPQPDDVTCGPTCLHAVYRHHGLDLDLEAVIGSVNVLHGGGTLAVYLGIELELNQRYAVSATEPDPELAALLVATWRRAAER